MTTQQQIFDLVYKKYKDVFPNMKHGSGGLPDSKGEGTSDVDICVKHADYANLAKYFPEDTKVDNQEGRTIYTLSGYDREVNIYCTDGDWWDNGAKHRKTEIALNKNYPELSKKAFKIKKETGKSTEEAWAEVLNLGEDFQEILFDTDRVLDIAKHIA
ncbi:hypothetical protein KC660_03025 [Candidatus Dojkabacteria bacterium]|uniref:Uncharacterized protein n=1 Tax=Candidatus Dojkabacteria bacterium TaxID=2099670 RepID=A0A955L3W3_9BACT|nr:hypothetical protein [Candidatus Dojkabacteria bacterium]